MGGVSSLQKKKYAKQKAKNYPLHKIQKHLFAIGQNASIRGRDRDNVKCQKYTDRSKLAKCRWFV